MNEGIMAFRGMIHSVFKNETECAKKMGWDKRKLNKITTGKKVPTIAELDELAHALGTTLGAIAPYFLPQKSPNGQQNEGAA